MNGDIHAKNQFVLSFLLFPFFIFRGLIETSWFCSSRKRLDFNPTVEIPGNIIRYYIKRHLKWHFHFFFFFCCMYECLGSYSFQSRRSHFKMTFQRPKMIMFWRWTGYGEYFKLNLILSFRRVCLVLNIWILFFYWRNPYLFIEILSFVIKSICLRETWQIYLWEIWCLRWSLQPRSKTHESAEAREGAKIWPHKIWPSLFWGYENITALCCHGPLPPSDNLRP